MVWEGGGGEEGFSGGGYGGRGEEGEGDLGDGDLLRQDDRLIGVYPGPGDIDCSSTQHTPGLKQQIHQSQMLFFLLDLPQLKEWNQFYEVMSMKMPTRRFRFPSLQ